MPEVFRRIAVPYAGAFGTSSRSALSDVVSVALGARQAAPKHTVRHRLSRAEDGAATDSHLHEFAAAFGFLEEAGSNYVPGKFALATHFIRHGVQRHPYYDRDRAERAVWLYALLERHGDCVLPILDGLDGGAKVEAGNFVENVRGSLVLKTARLTQSKLARNASFHEASTALARYCAAWGAGCTSPGRASAKAERLDDKTLEGYFARTVTYGVDNELLQRNRGVGLTQGGERLLAAWRAVAGLPSVEIPPSFEAIHDAFAADWPRYSETFLPAVTAGVFERAIAGTLLPSASLTHWTAYDFAEDYREVVSAIGDAISGAARVDAIRLALWANCVAIGLNVALDNEEPSAYSDANANAAIEIPLRNPRMYHLGHARTGRRFWSVTLLRRT